MKTLFKRQVSMNNSKRTDTIKSSLLLLVTASIWGAAFVAQRVGMDYVGGFTFNAVRFLLGALVLTPVLLVLKRLSPDLPLRQEIKIAHRRCLIRGSLLCGIFLCLASNFQQFGIKYTTVGKAGFITACYIILVPIFGLFLHKKCSPFIWAAVFLALAGLYLLCMTDSLSIHKGDILVMICAVLFAFQILAVDHYSPLMSGLELSIGQFIVSAIGSGIPALIFEKPRLSSIFAAWQPILYAGIFSCGIAYTLQIVGQRNLNPTVASLIMSLESCISAIAGFLILGQTLSVREILGCEIMFAAIILAQMPAPDSPS